MTQGNFTPRETVGELDRYIIGQHKAKRAVAIALRNRWRTTAGERATFAMKSRHATSS